MNHYIQQLIEDFRASAGRVPTEEEWLARINATSDQQYDELSCCEYIADPEAMRTLGELIGIPQEMIPPAEKLTDSQIVRLYNEMIDLLEAWHFVPSFPEETPIRLRYILLYLLWNERQPFVGIGELVIDFCSGVCEQCELKSYCRAPDQIPFY